MTQRRYSSLYERLVANTHAPETDDGCWLWSARHDRWGYGRINVYVPGRGGNVTLAAHVLLWAIVGSGATTADDAYLAYLEMRHADLELDHVCEDPRCIRPCHLTAVTPQQNSARRSGRPHHVPWNLPNAPLA